MIKLTSTCAFVKPVSVNAFKTISLYMVFVPTIPSSKNRSKIPLCHLRYEYVSPLYFLTKNNYYLAGSLLEGTLWNLLLAGERGLFHKATSLAVLDNASNQRHQTAQTTQTIILLGYYPHSQLRNTECYPMRKCDTGDCKYQTRKRRRSLAEEISSSIGFHMFPMKDPCP